MKFDRKLKVGLTGGIGVGKSYISKIIQKMGWPVFNSDIAAKKLMKNDKDLLVRVNQLFEIDVIDTNGQLLKQKFANELFNDNEKRKEVNALIHPIVRASFDEWTNQQSTKMVFNEAAILFETGSYKLFDSMILVCAPEKLKIQRVVNRDKISVEEVKLRMDSQWNDRKKMKLNPLVINNDESSPLLLQVEETIEKLEFIFKEKYFSN